MEKEHAVPFDFDNEDLFVVETLQYAGSEPAEFVGGGACNSNCNCNSSNSNDNKGTDPVLVTPGET
jgi:hypothetical protein